MPHIYSNTDSKKIEDKNYKETS
jgi:hypothetical protein